MVDPLGAAIGVVGLFSTCLSCWHLIEDGRSMSRDFIIQRQRYLNLRLRFELWGEACGLLDTCSHSEDGYIPQSIRFNVLETLCCIAALFENGDKLRRRYGLEADSALAAHSATNNQTGTSALQALTDQKGTLEQRIKQVKSHAGRLGSVRWAISDKPKFTALISHLGELVADLESLAQAINVRQKQQELAEREMQKITDLSELQTIEEAGLDNNDLISDAASSRISSLRNQLNEASDSSHCAHSSRADDESTATLGTESLPKIYPETQWQRILASLRQRESSFQQNLLINESKSGDLLLWRKAEHNLSQLPIGGMTERQIHDTFPIASAIVPWVDGWPIGDDFNEFIAAVEGPLGTPYEGSVFYLRITLSDRHPFRPPRCHFLTKIYHPNIDSLGRICFDLFSDGWSPIFTLTTVVVAISGLLTTPNIEDPLVPEIASIYVQDPQTYNHYARTQAIRHADPRLCPVVDADRNITFEICNSSLEEVICRLATRVVDDAFLLAEKYGGEIGISSRDSQHNSAKSQAFCQMSEDVITVSQKTAMFSRSLEVHKLRHEMLPRWFLFLKRTLGWLEDLLINSHAANTDQTGSLSAHISENTAWLIWALDTAVTDFKSSMAP